MAGLKFRILLAAPIVVFLIVCGVLALRGRQGAWHAYCVESWRTQEWAKLRSLARNLDRLGTPDPEADYFAALAASRQREKEAATRFAEQWQSRRTLNWNWEREMSQLAAPAGMLEHVRFYRARGAAVLLLLLVLFNLLSIRGRSRMLPSSLISCAGILLLMV